MGSPGSTMEITSRTDDLASNVFPQPGLDSPSAIPKPFGDITAGLQSFAELAADMATTDEIGWEQPARQEPAGNITAGVPALSTLLEEDEEGRTSAYGDENMSVNMDLTAETGSLHLNLHCPSPITVQLGPLLHPGMLLHQPNTIHVETVSGPTRLDPSK